MAIIGDAVIEGFDVLPVESGASHPMENKYRCVIFYADILQTGYQHKIIFTKQRTMFCLLILCNI